MVGKIGEKARFCGKDVVHAATRFFYDFAMDSNTAWLFAQAALIGLSIAAPVGPIGLLCIQRSLDDGWRVGLATGFGAAVADAIYGTIGAYGVHGLAQTLQALRPALALGGGGLLLWLAWRTWRAPAALGAAPGAMRLGAPAAFATTLLLTLSNPMTILAFAGIFASLGDMSAVRQVSPSLLVLGVFAGSALWWLLLSGGVSLARHRLPRAALHGVRRLSAVVLAGFGAWALLQGLI